MRSQKMRTACRLVRSFSLSSLGTQFSSSSNKFMYVNFATNICPSIYAYISNPTSVSLSTALQHYINCGSPCHGLKIHAHIAKIGFQPNTNITIKLLIIYLKSGFLEYARQVFDEMSEPTRSAYNYLMDGYVKHGRFGEVFDLVRSTRDCHEKPDGFTYALILKSCVSGCRSHSLVYDFGRQVHAQMVKYDLKEDVILFGSLLDTYVKCRRLSFARILFDTLPVKNVMCCTSLIAGFMNEGSVDDAELIFEKMIDKDVVVFNAMIEGFSKSVETAKKSVRMYIYMKRLDFQPTVSTFASLIGACSLLSSFEIGEQVQCQLMKIQGGLIDIKLSSALIDMYSKCGKVDDARKIFDDMSDKNVFSWTSMIDGYGKNGKANEALELFDMMQKEYQITPNYVTFLSVLSACAHNGLLEEGNLIFKTMESDYKLKPKMEHYSCMVDLLGRFGSIDEAWSLVKGMSEKPNSDVWAALLNSCRLHDEVEIANIAAEELFKIGGDGRAGAYVSLSNTLAASGQWDGVVRVREHMKMRKILKDTGFTWVGNDGNIEKFHVG